MNRYRTYGPNDDNPEVIGDGGFNRLDMLTDPALLAPGSLTISENMRFDVDGLTVRGGLSRQFAAGTNVGRILHAGTYVPSQNDERLAFMTGNGLAIFDPTDQSVQVLAYPAGVTVGQGDHVDSIQAGLDDGTLPQLWLLRGLGESVLKYDGNNSVMTDPDFQPGEFALYYQDRIAVNGTTQAAYVSNFDDFDTWSLLNQFQIQKGGDEYLTHFRSYQKDYVLIGTNRSWYVAFFQPQIAGSGPTSAGYEGPLAGDQSFLRQITREAGPVGPRAAIDANGLVFFIADQAIYAFTPQLDNELTVLGRPISAELDPIMRRMNTANARLACVERWGYRLYFALPISDEPLPVPEILVVTQTSIGIDLPFDLPVNLAAGAIVEVIMSVPHNLSAGDEVLIAGAPSPGLNGQFTVAGVQDETTWYYATDADPGELTGSNMTMQKLAPRNNRIAVYNLKSDSWESIDTLPAGFSADWMRVVQYGLRQRLWIIDRDLGPALYEENDQDDMGITLGGADLPFDLPVDLNPANYATQQIQGHLTTRCFRWGYMGTTSGDYTGRMTTAAVPRKVRQCEVRGTLDAASAVTLSLTVRTPNNVATVYSKDFVRSQFKTDDVRMRKLSGKRGLEAQVDITTSGGRPTVRSVEIETVAVGRVEE